MSTLVAPRRDTRTYVTDGQERYADTGRPVAEQLGSHIVLWIVDNAEAWATSVEAEGDRQVTDWPKKMRHIGEHRRTQAHQSAAQIRTDGNQRTVYSIYHSDADADASAADLRRHHQNPGVRYEVAAIEQVDACPTEHCRQPRFLADNTWWHHYLRYPAHCAPPRAAPQPDPEPEPGDFVIDADRGTMRCGWCEQTEQWDPPVPAHLALGYLTLTGFHLLGVHHETRHLVVLAEATNLSGATTYLPHHCEHIPEDVHTKFAPNTVLVRPADPTPAGDR